jgi:2-polyprenyl-3-methyl-5-hydroxy-6-metoxy-1,4-benzoquinol methylase
MTATTIDPQRQMDFVGRLFAAASGSLELATIYLGECLGLYRALADGGPLTVPELAAATSTAERYAREWVEAQAVCGFVDVDDATLPADERRYALPPEHADALLNRESLAYLAPMARFMAASAGVMRHVVEAFRSGGGVPYEAYGAEYREAQQDFTRPLFANLLGGWIEAMPDVHARLLRRPPARVVDMACGAGIACVELAKRYPDARVEGIDLDEGAIDMARANARAAGVDVRFHLRDATAPALDGRFDLITMFDSLHHLARPLDALRAMRALVSDDGAVLIVESRTGEHFQGPRPADDFERFAYMVSVLHCLPTAMAEQPSAGLGMVVREPVLRQLAADAGFSGADVLAVEHSMLRFYRLVT